MSENDLRDDPERLKFVSECINVTNHYIQKTLRPYIECEDIDVLENLAKRENIFIAVDKDFFDIDFDPKTGLIIDIPYYEADCPDVRSIYDMIYSDKITKRLAKSLCECLIDEYYNSDLKWNFTDYVAFGNLSVKCWSLTQLYQDITVDLSTKHLFFGEIYRIYKEQVLEL